MAQAKILIIDDDPDVLQSARMFLKQEFATVTIEENPQRLLRDISIPDYDAILLDMNFRNGVNDGEEGFQWLEHIRAADPNANLDTKWRHPMFGDLNWREWLLFLRIHAQDHARQLEKMDAQGG